MSLRKPCRVRADDVGSIDEPLDDDQYSPMESQPSFSSPVHRDLAAQIVTPDIPMDAFLSQPNIPQDQALPTYGGKPTPYSESF
jgi:hypothetical protein